MPERTRRSHRTLSALLAVMISGIALAGAAYVAPTTIAFIVPDFKKISYPSGDKEVNQLVESRRSLTSHLRSQLSYGNLSGEQQTYVIYLLGEFRAEDAVADLMSRVDFKAPVRDLKLSIPRWGEYPAIEALVKIGKRSTWGVLISLPQKQTALRLKLMAAVLQEVEGKAGARALLENGIGKADDGTTVDNMSSLLKLILAD